LSYSLEAFERCEEIDGIAVVAPKERLGEVQRMVELFGYTKVRKIISGRAQRMTSVRAGMAQLDEDVSIVLVHEASRPCIDIEVIADTVKATKRYGCAIAAAKLVDPVKIAEKGQQVTKTLDANTTWAGQSPQGFKRELLEKVCDSSSKKLANCQDESMALERMKQRVHIVNSPPTNLRVTTPEELTLAECLLRL
jgi:2-C-methyl-D-erythritol 4-phosphate cytidylyltransferase